MSKLAEICATKREHIKSQKSEIAEESLRKVALEKPPARGFIKAIENKISSGNIAIIAEIKKASPSKGLIREDFDVAEIAKIYEASGAACVSVLTDKPYFQGDDAYLEIASNNTSLPLLRKDFMLDSYQITESRALGADCVLLIMSALGDNQAAELEQAAFELGMDVLVEVHDEEELERALKLKSRLIGVNNRSLKTLQVSLENAERMANLIPENRIRVCESGVFTRDDILRMQKSGYSTFLIGESLMRQQDIGMALTELLR